MIRKRVLEKWRSFKERYSKGLDLLDQTDDGLSNMAFGTGSLGIKETPYQVMEELKSRLPSITQHCQELRNKYTSRQFGDPIFQVEQIYFAYIELVLVYEKIIEYYNDSCDSQSRGGPTIEIVD
jgi:hypothetical protein